MAAAGVINVISVVARVLGIVQFGMDNFAPPESVGSTVKIQVGLDFEGGLNNAGGDLPDIRLFNEAGKFLGMAADPGGVGDGATGEVKVDHIGDSGQQAAYALFSANNNAICIASASITWPNGDNYGWVGDWGQACGGSWFYSNVFIKGSGYKPNCLWIDGNGDQPQTGFQVHWPEFVQRSEGQLDQIDVDYYCNSGPPFKMYTDPEPSSITYWVLSNGEKKRDTTTTEGLDGYSPTQSGLHARRQLQRRQAADNSSTSAPFLSLSQRLSDLLVFDDATDHSAIELCASETSLGPDFASTTEELFCRMSDKTLWPFCGSTYVDDCFDVNLQQLVVGGKVTRDRKYTKVMNWGGSGKGASGTK
ncbi:hypothetical protein QBC42DRAFT_279985 [Cladorrhinum samala]|uniref:Uncharacterized protein n=1 Tax=Cladorrhinum samala TaxID=585594 RepID=A0AAV9HD74_9PEZI|nr:hypothetical protein QBC42DRAFT_279985 [Cladorrhinum samala]